MRDVLLALDPASQFGQDRQMQVVRLERYGARATFARASLARGAALVVSVLANTATAQPADVARSHSSLAEALFQDGKRLLADGRVAEACLKLAESQRVEAALGTLLNLAVCHQRQGKTASAWSEFSDALALAEQSGQVDRARFARSQLAALRDAIPHLIVRVAAPHSALRVTLDGAVLGRAAWGSAVPLDPGEHRVTAEAPGRKTWTMSVMLAADGAARVLDVPPLALDGPPTRVAKPAVAATASIAPASPGRRTWGFISGGAALLSLGAGAYWGLRVLSEQNIVQAHCDAGRCRNEAGMTANRKAHDAARWADLGFGVGITAAAASTYLLLTSRSASPQAAANAQPGGKSALSPQLLSVAWNATALRIDAGVSF